METKNYFSTDAAGNIIPGAQVYVNLPGTSSPAPGITNINGAPLANPFTAASSGLVQFKAPDGEYDLRVVGGGREFTIRIQCFDGLAFSQSVGEIAARVDAIYSNSSGSEGAGVIPFSQDLLYPPSTAGFRFKRTLHSKDSPFNCVADGVTDDSDALVALFAMSRALGGRCEIVIDDGVHAIQKLVQFTSNTTITFVGSFKVLANPAAGTDCVMLPVNGASNVTLVNPQIDCNNIPAVNGVVCRTGNSGFLCIGGDVRNCAHDKTGTKGGRAYLVESLQTSLNNRAPKFIAPKATNCYMAFALQGGSGTATTPINGGRSLALCEGLSADSCDIGIGLFGVPAAGSTFTYPYAPEVMHGLFANPVFRNCGKNTQYTGQDGVIASDRASNIDIFGFSAFNTSDYATIDSVVRGNFASCKIHGIFRGAAASVIAFSPYKEADGGPASENSVVSSDFNIDVLGTVADFIKNTTNPGAAYVTKTTVKGSADVVTSARAVPANFVVMNSLGIDLFERTQISRIKGQADQVSGTLFTALPGKEIDLNIGRVGAIDVRGDLSVTSFAPSHFMRDQSTSARDGKCMVDADSFGLYMERTQGTDTFDPFLLYNAATVAGRVYAGQTVVFGWNAGYLLAPALGNYASDSAAAAGGVPVGGVYRNAGVMTVRVV